MHASVPLALAIYRAANAQALRQVARHVPASALDAWAGRELAQGDDLRVDRADRALGQRPVLRAVRDVNRPVVRLRQLRECVEGRASHIALGFHEGGELGEPAHHAGLRGLATEANSHPLQRSTESADVIVALGQELDVLARLHPAGRREQPPERSRDPAGQEPHGHDDPEEGGQDAQEERRRLVALDPLHVDDGRRAQAGDVVIERSVGGQDSLEECVAGVEVRARESVVDLTGLDHRHRRVEVLPAPRVGRVSNGRELAGDHREVGDDGRRRPEELRLLGLGGPIGGQGGRPAREKVGGEAVVLAADRLLQLVDQVPEREELRGSRLEGGDVRPCREVSGNLDGAPAPDDQEQDQREAQSD